MKLLLDTIQFENKWEIKEIIEALEKWQQKNNKENKTVKELIDKLEAMLMYW